MEENFRSFNWWAEKFKRDGTEYYYLIRFPGMQIHGDVMKIIFGELILAEGWHNAQAMTHLIAFKKLWDWTGIQSWT